MILDRKLGFLSQQDDFIEEEASPFTFEGAKDFGFLSTTTVSLVDWVNAFAFLEGDGWPSPVSCLARFVPKEKYQKPNLKRKWSVRTEFNILDVLQGTDRAQRP
jgi:hypothetical protein